MSPKKPAFPEQVAQMRLSPIEDGRALLQVARWGNLFDGKATGTGAEDLADFGLGQLQLEPSELQGNAALALVRFRSFT